MTIDGIYDAAKARGLVGSRRQFSRDYLGRAANYAADTKLERCGAGALLNLYRRLGEARHTDLQAEALRLLLAAEDRDGGVRAARP